MLVLRVEWEASATERRALPDFEMVFRFIRSVGVRSAELTGTASAHTLGRVSVRFPSRRLPRYSLVEKPMTELRKEHRRAADWPK